MTRPLIQIDDFGATREMTEEEHADYLERYANEIALFSADTPDA
jgi:hypothetical protein